MGSRRLPLGFLRFLVAIGVGIARFAGSPLTDGRVDMSAVAPGYVPEDGRRAQLPLTALLSERGVSEPGAQATSVAWSAAVAFLAASAAE